MYRSSVLFLLALALLSLTAPSWATVIYVSGDQTGTWAADTVIVTAEVRVPPGQMLTISPGVEVLFSVYCKLIVDNGATLLAVGTAADSIRFDVLPPNTIWHGIRFLAASDSSRLEYCLLKHGHAAGGGEDSKGGAIYCYSSSPTIRNSTIIQNSASAGGSGIYCSNNSSPIINGNTISGNSTGVSFGGAGIDCYESSPVISGNTISYDSGPYDYPGAGIACESSNPDVSGNIICGNQNGAIACYDSSSPNIRNNSIYFGGGYEGRIVCDENSNPLICGNLIRQMYGFWGVIRIHNSAPTIVGNIMTNLDGNYVGGIRCEGASHPIISHNILSQCQSDIAYPSAIAMCDSSSAVISHNIIKGGSCLNAGAAVWPGNGSTITGNLIYDNYSNMSGSGGISGGSPVASSGNTICSNFGYDGGGISLGSGGLYTNCIVWFNEPSQIVGGGTPVSYSDVQDGWPGLGNITPYPAFVDPIHKDYRLQWDSPCIDSGNPYPIYNDPDGTRADMGAFYYDQRIMVRILLTPHVVPYVISEAGGSMDYTIRAFNRDLRAHAATIWCDVTLPDSSVSGPVLGPVTVTLHPEALVERVRTQNVPARAPLGVYYYNAYAVVGEDTSKDSFMWGKVGPLAADPWSVEASVWTNTGESLEFPLPSEAIRPRPVD